ncbi:MAG: ankyrin repeat domain-containing protein [Candidatus Babeliales bacterium]|nr:ankyrin repeat domain-containing protein [Candidatus Babeliales bacterium]
MIKIACATTLVFLFSLSLDGSLMHQVNRSCVRHRLVELSKLTTLRLAEYDHSRLRVMHPCASPFCSSSAMGNPIKSQEELLNHAIISGSRLRFSELMAQSDNRVALVQKKYNGQPALHTALQMQQEDMAYAIIDVLPHVEQTDVLGQTALHIAAERSSGEMVQHLIARKPSVDAQGINGQTPMIEAVGNLNRGNKLTTVNHLLHASAKTNIVDMKGNGPLHMLSVYSPNMVRSQVSNRIVRLLLSAHADPNKANECGITPLQVHARFLSQKNVALLIGKGADPSIVDDQGRTLIHYAVLSQVDHHPNDFKATLECLMQAGVAPDVSDKDGKTAYQLARELNKPEHMSYYLDAAQKGPNILKSAHADDCMHETNVIAIKAHVLEAQLAAIRSKKTTKPDYVHISDCPLTYEQKMTYELELDVQWLEVYAKTTSDKELLHQVKLMILELGHVKAH